MAAPAVKSLAPDLFEKLLAVGALAMLAFVIAALFKGRAELGALPPALWGHLATIGTALILTPFMLLRRRGDFLHRRAGWVWAVAMLSTALISLNIRGINHGGFSVIHLLSVFVLIMVPVAVITARRHNVARHRRTVRGLVLGALLVAGFFTFPFERLLGHWLFG